MVQHKKEINGSDITRIKYKLHENAKEIKEKTAYIRNITIGNVLRGLSTVLIAMCGLVFKLLIIQYFVLDIYFL